MCPQQACRKRQEVVTMLLFYQVATRLSLTTCYQVIELQDDIQVVGTICNKSVEFNNILATSWKPTVQTLPVDRLLEQQCYKSAAGLLRVYLKIKPRHCL
jgi:hypothetical protein